MTPLLLACNCGHAIAIFELLSHSDVDITNTSDHGSGVIGEFLQGLSRLHGDIRPMLLLLLYNAPLNQRVNNTGLTPLHIACLQYLQDSCVLLVSFGADTDMVSYDGSNITDLLMDRNNKNDHSACGILTVLLDIKKDLDISSLSSRGKTPLILAVDMLVAGAGEETFDFLCKHVKDQSIADKTTGRSVLHELAQLGSYELVENILISLWRKGVYSDNKDFSGETPESIARAEAGAFADDDHRTGDFWVALADDDHRTGDYYVQRRSRYLRIAELIHSFSLEFEMGNWRKRTNHGLKPDNVYKKYASRRRL
jgi:ankyrin repeat protein